MYVENSEADDIISDYNKITREMTIPLKIRVRR